MNVEAIARFVQMAPFREIVWLAPAAYAVHIAEEFWRFPLWASTYFAPGFTTHRFVVANALIMLVLLGLTGLVSAVRVRAVDFVYFCWISGSAGRSSSSRPRPAIPWRRPRHSPGGSTTT